MDNKHNIQFTEREFDYIDIKKRRFQFIRMHEIDDVHLKANTLEEIREVFFQMKGIKKWGSFYYHDEKERKRNRLDDIIDLSRNINLVLSNNQSHAD